MDRRRTVPFKEPRRIRSGGECRRGRGPSADRSDYGFDDDDGFILPPSTIGFMSSKPAPSPDMLFDAPAFGLA